MFVNNSAKITGNSIYFNVPRPYIFRISTCTIYHNYHTGNSRALLHIPCQFNYSQPVNGKMIEHPM